MYVGECGGRVEVRGRRSCTCPHRLREDEPVLLDTLPQGEEEEEGDRRVRQALGEVDHAHTWKDEMRRDVVRYGGRSGEM